MLIPGPSLEPEIKYEDMIPHPMVHENSLEMSTTSTILGR